MELAAYEHDRLSKEYKTAYRESVYIEKMAKQYCSKTSIAGHCQGDGLLQDYREVWRVRVDDEGFERCFSMINFHASVTWAASWSSLI